MDNKVKALWLEALRSGEYDQAKGTLKEDQEDGSVGYCCLGVLCEVAVQEGVIKPAVPWKPIDDDDYMGNCGHYKYDTEMDVLPDAVMEWAGINSKSGMLPEFFTFENSEHTAGSLVDLNDDFHFDFNQIADVIEGQF